MKANSKIAIDSIIRIINGIKWSGWKGSFYS